MPKVSIIIPVYNRTDVLSRALRSVQAQSFQDFEILIVDDHSTQEIRMAISDFSYSYLKTQGKGVSAARNTGIRSAAADLIAFLDSDDEWLPTKLEKQMAYLSENPHLSIVHTNEIWIREGQTVKQNSKQKKFGGRIFSQCTERCLIGPSSVLIRKSLLDRVGVFDESFPVCEDFDLWLRIAESEEVGFLTEALILKHGGHADQLSMQFHSMDLWRVRALAKHFGNKTLSESDRLALCNSLQLRCKILLKGFEKHKNFEFQDEVSGYLRKLI
jgi:glycosyltransferase involved in cell wall biosynthesis